MKPQTRGAEGRVLPSSSTGALRDPPPPSIAGKVMDEGGRAVAGIELSAEPVRLFEAPARVALSASLAQSVSDAAGDYHFAQLPEGEYRIRTTETGLYVPAEIVVRTGVLSADLVVLGERKLSIQGMVKDRQGNPLERVRVFPIQTPSLAAFTDDAGLYRLQIPMDGSNRAAVLRFALEGYRDESHRLNENQIEGQSVARLDAVLTAVKATTVIAGRVTDQEGRALAGEPVYLMGLARYQTVTNQAGLFALTDVEVGQSYKFRVPLHSPYRPYVEQLQVGAEGALLDVVVERGPPESASLSGRMMDAAGNPLPRFTLWLQSYSPEARGPVQVTSDDRGRYALGDVPLGTLSFTTRSQPRLVVNGISLPEGGAENVDLILDWGEYEVSGRVIDQDGGAAPGAKVTLFWSYRISGMQCMSERETATDADGFFRFAQLGPGSHSIRVSVPGFPDSRLEHNVGADQAPVVVQLEGNRQTALIRN